RVLRDDRRQRDERCGVARPAMLDRKLIEIGLEHELLAAAAAHDLRYRVRELLQPPEALDLLDETLRRLHLEHVLELARNIVELLHAEGEAHAPLGAELVDEQRVRRALRVAEEKRRPARLHGAVDDL